LSQVCSQEALKSSKACLTRRGFPKKTTPSNLGNVRQALPLHLEKGENQMAYSDFTLEKVQNTFDLTIS
jgi:hypothetical protein